MRAARPPLHQWNLQPEQAIALQKELASRVIREDRLPSKVQHIAGVDLAINENNGLARAAVVLLAYPSLQLEEQHVYEEPVRMEYIPGLLSFRELPCVLGALNLLQQEPDLIMVDGQGIAHPRRLGIASHLGLWLDLPTIGCAKSVLRGHYNEQELGEAVGSWVPLRDQGEVIGAALRTREHTKPMIISIGHRVSLDTSIRYVLSCCRGYRLPEPTRLADRLSKNNAYREPASGSRGGQGSSSEAIQDSLWQ
uniref:Endonuclease V n=1 Tax=Thermogemmatispora argillosa TaxID=2045280 RepID=A0A455T5G7_9CHLR|nr:endonuclease V [Thermogemmatispora argillosa]